MKWVNISKQKPPQWILDAVKEKWGVEWKSSVIFTYNGVISSSTGKMTRDLMSHERTHIQQQKDIGNGDIWWKKYLEDDKFRYSQELEAYQNQYRWLLNNEPNKNERFRFLMHYAHSLSGAMYGNMVDFNEAMQSIKNC